MVSLKSPIKNLHSIYMNHPRQQPETIRGAIQAKAHAAYVLSDIFLLLLPLPCLAIAGKSILVAQAMASAGYRDAPV
jgi:hypothetical protein